MRPSACGYTLEALEAMCQHQEQLPSQTWPWACGSALGACYQDMPALADADGRYQPRQVDQEPA